MKAAMELEYVIKFMILLVVLVVVIGIVLIMSSDTQSWWCNLMGTCNAGPEPGSTEVIKQTVFYSSDVAKYVDSCWLKTGEDYNNDLVCYVLQGTFETMPEDVYSELRTFQMDKLIVDTDFRGDSAVIKFIDIGNKIEIS